MDHPARATRPRSRFYAVVSLGRNICGHPRIVHGGLTAALIDETLGCLMFALKNSWAISLPGPMFTVRAGARRPMAWAGVVAGVGPAWQPQLRWQGRQRAQGLCGSACHRMPCDWLLPCASGLLCAFLSAPPGPAGRELQGQD